MPLVFGLLVVLNAVFLAWQFFEQQSRGQNTVIVMEQPEGKKIELLLERPDIAQNAQEVEGAALLDERKSNTTTRDADRACYRVGPLMDTNLAKQLKINVEKAGFDVEISSSNAGSSKYLLYIPPVASEEKANSVIKELQKQGVAASIITESSMANGISLGTVSDYDEAESIKAKVASLGYRVDTKTTLSSHQEQWLVINNVYSAGKTQIDRMLAGSPQLRREKIACR